MQEEISNLSALQIKCSLNLSPHMLNIAIEFAFKNMNPVIAYRGPSDSFDFTSMVTSIRTRKSYYLHN